MDNQHRKIKGYRELTQAEIDLMNEIKQKGIEIDSLIAKLQEHHTKQWRACIDHVDTGLKFDNEESQRLDSAEPDKWRDQGKIHIQTGLMCLTRSVAQPTFF